MNNPLEMFFPKLASALKLQRHITPLIKAVNKLSNAAGKPGAGDNRERIPADDSIPQDLLMGECVRTVNELAETVKADRLKNVAALKAAREEKAKPAVMPEAKAEVTAPDGKALAGDLILFRDQLAYFGEDADEKGDEKLARAMKRLYTETGRVLERNGVKEINDTGLFDTERHKVTSTKPTEDEAAHNTIAETFRPGYMIDGTRYRPQEVVIYMNVGR